MIFLIFIELFRDKTEQKITAEKDDYDRNVSSLLITLLYLPCKFATGFDNIKLFATSLDYIAYRKTILDALNSVKSIIFKQIGDCR